MFYFLCGRKPLLIFIMTANLFKEMNSVWTCLRGRFDRRVCAFYPSRPSRESFAFSMLQENLQNHRRKWQMFQCRDMLSKNCVEILFSFSGSTWIHKQKVFHFAPPHNQFPAAHGCAQKNEWVKPINNCISQPIIIKINFAAIFRFIIYPEA